MNKRIITYFVVAFVGLSIVAFIYSMPPKKPSKTQISNTFESLFQTLPVSNIAKLRGINISGINRKNDNKLTAIASYDAVFTANSDKIIPILLKNQGLPENQMTKKLMLSNLKKSCRLDKIKKGAVCPSRILLIFEFKNNTNSKGWKLIDYNRNIKKQSNS